jgi:serine protease Do
LREIVRVRTSGYLTIEDIPYKELITLQLEGAVRVKNVEAGRWKDAGIRDGFIISHIDKIPVDNAEDLNRILDFKRGGILIEGVYNAGRKGVSGVEW